MRTIERLMNQAITGSKNWKLRNTKVVYDEATEISYVYLHNNLIAKIGETWIQLFDGGYRSKTTKSRLNAILMEHGAGEGIFQRDWVWYIQDGGQVSEFENGMILN